MSEFVCRIRTLALIPGLVLLCALLPLTKAEAKPDATTSIIKGNPTTISQWPWQVAIARSTLAAPGQSPWRRSFCGGSILAPTIVLTAGHCAIDMIGSPASDYAVISGRTNLDAESTGQEVRLSRVLFARTAAGAIRYRFSNGWDVALLVLKQPLESTPVKLLGPDEQGIVVPGRRLIETGWGTTITGSDFSPKTLMKGGTNIQPGSICSGLLGKRFFSDSLQICLGDSLGLQANCYGDSGGPAVVATTAGYRQVGLTSSGTAGNCAGTIPNVDVLVGGKTIRGWIRSTVLERTGIDPVGAGGSGTAVGTFCRVPVVRGLSLTKARSRLTSSGCSRVEVARRGSGSRVKRAPAPPGFLWDPEKPIRLLIGD